MKAYTISRYSKTDPLQWVDVPEKPIQEHEVMVEVHAARINPLDVKLKAGEFKMILPYRFPLILGHDVAGIVTQIGSKVTKFRIGDAVFARPADFHIGTFAEYIAVRENDLAKKPESISMEEAASLPLVALTAWQALVEKAQLSKGQKVFIQAGSGGVGTVAIQLAKQLGATVATTTSAENADLVKRLGADIVIDYKTQDFETILKDYDVVLHSQDEKKLIKSMNVLKRGGKLISISGPADGTYAKELNFSWILRTAIYFMSRKVTKLAKRLGVDYSFLFMKANGQQLSEISRYVDSGAIRPVVDKVFPFHEINEAMSYVNTGRVKGKVVLKLR